MLYVWDAKTGETRYSVRECGESLTGVAFSPDGTQLAAVGRTAGRTVHLFDGETGKRTWKPEGHRGSIGAVCFHGDARVVSGSLDGTLRISDAATGEEMSKTRRPLR